MTLLLSAARLAVLLVIFAVAIAFGSLCLRAFRARSKDPIGQGLMACGIGFFALELAVLALNVPGWLNRASAWCVIVVAAAIGWNGWRSVRDFAVSFASEMRSQWKNGGRAAQLLLVCASAVCLLEGVVASAPLTGSDAMHYHFTVPRLQISGPLQPRFDITTSFFTGQAHLLISFGLALGSDRFALGFIYLGGLLTAVTLYVIAKEISSSKWALLAVLTFLISPMVFWQITTSGSPDIWMGFYAGIAVIAAWRALEARDSRLAILAGLLAGNAAGVKYTGWIIPIAICAYLLMSFRPRITAIWAGCAALLGGCLPLVRNAVWTNDPLFPFLTKWLNPSHLNYYVLGALRSETHPVGFSVAPLHILAFPFLLATQGQPFGLGQYFGPAILAFAPLLIVAAWKNQLARLCACVWALTFLANAVSTQMGRFLLPVFSIALALVFSGIAGAARRNWGQIVYACAATLLLFIAFSGASDLLYAKDFLPVAVGIESREAFLHRMATDYQIASFVNETLAARQKEQGGTVLVFFRHLYYLRVPFVNGDPDSSWIFDPAKCNNAAGLLQILKEQNVHWVVTSSEYQHELAGAFRELQAEGKLTPIASRSVESFTGDSRIYRQTASAEATIFRLQY
ncbi:MAG TPA: glycosyltransferase family 39 protein [Candidatus Acidoferrales bacterium]|nr:glycosyltransferase family 39 protein [Candidatus Acidoferrales bacterium]